MILTIIRTLDTQEFVGIFAALDIVGIRTLVDETCTPSQCEYAVLESGGFYATSASTEDNIEYAPTALLCAIISDPDGSDWLPLDPNCESFGSQIDALLATQAGRDMISEQYAANAKISLAPPMAA